MFLSNENDQPMSYLDLSNIASQSTMEEWKRKRQELEEERRKRQKLINPNFDEEEFERLEEETKEHYEQQNLYIPLKHRRAKELMQLTSQQTEESQPKLSPHPSEYTKPIEQPQVTSESKPIQMLTTSWSPPSFIKSLSPKKASKIRAQHAIQISGDDIPNPITAFEHFKFPPFIIDRLKKHGIQSPTPIQIQGLPALLSGRDVIGIAFTGSGKTLTFVLPAIMLALQEELKMPLISFEGPISLIVCPSRELAKQTFDIVSEYAKCVSSIAELRLALCTGGTKLKEQESQLKKGVHIVVATPGRLLQMLNEKMMNLDLCMFVCLDEADRLVDVGFEDEVRMIFNHFPLSNPRQTALFSSIMHPKIQLFAESVLTNPILITVAKSGAEDLDVVQEVEYVKPDAKLVYLLECLQKTAPPTLIFCESKTYVDEIYSYLSSKGVAVARIHGSKNHEERARAIEKFRKGRRDVLVATDVASKGLDFPNVRHVINFDMPKTIENYVHRISKTGKSGRTGLVTTFINRNDPESILLELKHLLFESKQKVPPVLASLKDH